MMTREQFEKCINLINSMDNEKHAIHRGSEKQNAWAEEIRAAATEKIKSLDIPTESKEISVKLFDHVCSADIWIDNRSLATHPTMLAEQLFEQLVKVHNL